MYDSLKSMTTMKSKKTDTFLISEMKWKRYMKKHWPYMIGKRTKMRCLPYHRNLICEGVTKVSDEGIAREDVQS